MVLRLEAMRSRLDLRNSDHVKELGVLAVFEPAVFFGQFAHWPSADGPDPGAGLVTPCFLSVHAATRYLARVRKTNDGFRVVHRHNRTRLVQQHSTRSLADSR